MSLIREGGGSWVRVQIADPAIRRKVVQQETLQTSGEASAGEWHARRRAFSSLKDLGFDLRTVMGEVGEEKTKSQGLKHLEQMGTLSVSDWRYWQARIRELRDVRSHFSPEEDEYRAIDRELQDAIDKSLGSARVHNLVAAKSREARGKSLDKPLVERPLVDLRDAITQALHDERRTGKVDIPGVTAQVLHTAGSRREEDLWDDRILPTQRFEDGTNIPYTARALFVVKGKQFGLPDTWVVNFAGFKGEKMYGHNHGPSLAIETEYDTDEEEQPYRTTNHLFSVHPQEGDRASLRSVRKDTIGPRTAIAISPTFVHAVIPEAEEPEGVSFEEMIADREKRDEVLKNPQHGKRASILVFLTMRDRVEQLAATETGRSLAQYGTLAFTGDGRVILTGSDVMNMKFSQLVANGKHCDACFVLEEPQNTRTVPFAEIDSLIDTPREGEEVWRMSKNEGGELVQNGPLNERLVVDFSKSA